MKKKPVNLDDFEEVAAPPPPSEVITDPSQIKTEPEKAAAKPVNLDDFEEVNERGRPVSSTPFEGVPIVAEREHTPNALEAGVGGFFGGLLDEASAALTTDYRGKSPAQAAAAYRVNRDIAREEIGRSMEEHPGAAFAGGLASAAAVPAGGAARAVGLGAKVLQGVKAGAGFGAASALGTSEADLTRGEVGEAARDVVEGAAAGAVVGGAIPVATTALGATGRVITRTLAPGARQRLEDQAISRMGRMATEPERRALEASRPEVIAEMRANPELRASVRDPKAQAALAAEAKSGVQKEASDVIAAADKAVGGRSVGASLARLEARQAELAANPATAPEAARIGKLIERVRGMYEPLKEEVLDTPGIVAGLAKGAGKKAKERLAIKASDVGEVINAYGLKAHAKDPQAFADATNKAVSQVGKRIGEVYQAVDDAGGRIPLAQAMRGIDKVLEEYRKNPATKSLVQPLERLLEDVRGEWSKFPAVKQVPMVPVTAVHDFVSSAGRQWQPSNVFDPTIANEMRRKVWGATKDILDDHVATVAERNPSIKKVGDLAELNREYSALKIVQKLAVPKAELAKVAPVVAPAAPVATRTGQIPQTALREMAEALPAKHPARAPLQETVAAAAEKAAPGTTRAVEQAGRRKGALEAIENAAATRGQREPFVGTSRFSELMTEAGDKGATVFGLPYRVAKAGAKMARERLDEAVVGSAEKQAAQAGALGSNDIAIARFAKMVRAGGLSDDQLVEQAAKLGLDADRARKVMKVFTPKSGRRAETATRAAAAEAGER